MMTKNTNIQPADFAGAWIGTDGAKPFYARKSFVCEKEIVRAQAAVCGLGQFILYLNGKKVGNHELDPGWTNYDKKVQYVCFDVTSELVLGENVMGVSVGNGFYLADRGERYFFEMPPEAMRAFMPPNTNGYQPFGDCLPLKVLLVIDYADGGQVVITSDESWKVAESACTLANVYGSEIYDARNYPKGWNEAGFDASAWADARTVHAPKGVLTLQTQPPIVVKQTYEAKLLGQQDDGYLYDFGQNMSCMLELTVKGARGQCVDMLVAEKLDGEGRLDQMAKNWNLIDVSCTYILSGERDGETWRQEFSYVGARYVFIKGASPEQILSLKGHFIVSDSPLTGTFSCDNEKYNQVYQLIVEAIDSNLKSVHTDCPSIEKTAWLEESHLLAPSIMYYRDVRDLWKKIFDDALIDQYGADTAENDVEGKPFYRGAGFLPPIAPAYGKMVADSPLGSFWDLIAWSSFPILAAKWYYLYYGDASLIADGYDSACAYVDYLAGKVNDDGFIAHGLGDWGNPMPGAQATANVESAYYYHVLMTMAEFSAILDKPAQQAKFSALAENVCRNYNRKLLVQNDSGRWCYRAWDHKDELFCTQACQALPYEFGMVPEDKKNDVFDTLKELVESNGFVSGEIGFPSILRVLEANGCQQLIWEKAMSEKDFSYYHFVLSGETALGEYWEDNPRSHNHDMMGSLLELFYSSMAGIRPLSPGFERVQIKPVLPRDVHTVRCSFRSVKGEISVSIHDGGADIVLPKGVTAEVDLSGIGC